MRTGRGGSSGGVLTSRSLSSSPLFTLSNDPGNSRVCNLWSANYDSIHPIKKEADHASVASCAVGKDSNKPRRQRKRNKQTRKLPLSSAKGRKDLPVNLSHSLVYLSRRSNHRTQGSKGCGTELKNHDRVLGGKKERKEKDQAAKT
jgi:hypothetical protein